MERNNTTMTLKAGVAKSNITTDASGTMVNDPLYAKVLVLDDGITRIVIIAMDAVAIGCIGDIKDDFLPKLRSRIQNELGIDGQNVLVNASHTHPPGRLLCNDTEQINRTFDAVSRALQNMQEVKIGVGVGHEDRIMINRTLKMKNGLGWTIRHANPCPPDDEVEGVGRVDPDIGIIRIDKLDGHPLAVIYNFACHPLLGVPKGTITANYPGFASKVIEENLGDGAMALFLQGAGGDITEVLYKDNDRPRDSEPAGTMLGLSTLKALRDIKTENVDLKVVSKTVDFPRRTDVPQQIEFLLAEQAELLASLRFTSLNFRTFLPLYLKYALNPEYPMDYSYHYMQSEQIGNTDLEAMDKVNKANLEKYISNIRAMERLARIQDKIATLKLHKAFNDESGEETIKAEVMGIKIGDCVLISCPTEALVEVGLNVKAASPYTHTFMAAYSNGYMHYGPPAEDYNKGGYEVTECFLAPEWQQIYEQTAAEIIRRL